MLGAVQMPEGNGIVPNEDRNEGGMRSRRMRIAEKADRGARGSERKKITRKEDHRNEDHREARIADGELHRGE